MWDKTQYALIYLWTQAHAILPLRALYLLSDALYALIYKIARYRVKVVRRNMAASFPEKTAEELREMEHKFYHHFSDYVVETLKLANISLKNVRRRARLENPELVDKLVEEGHDCCLLLMSHYGNWEWYTCSSSYFKETRVYQIYRPLSNKAVDRLFIFLRTRFGSLGIKKDDTIRDIVRLRQEKRKSAVIFIADQTPSPNNLHYWTDFLNQDTPFLTGAERIARKMNLPVVFVDTRKTGRGYYSVQLRLLTDKPRETPEFWITEQYARLTEKCILREPAYWLWTHKRWKHKR